MTKKQHILIISTAFALAFGGAAVYYFLVPRLLKLDKPFDKENQKAIAEAELE